MFHYKRNHIFFSTIITIAHRLNTILDYDRVMVLSEGRVVELDPPKQLMHKEGTVFRSMCQVAAFFYYYLFFVGLWQYAKQKNRQLILTFFLTGAKTNVFHNL